MAEPELTTYKLSASLGIKSPQGKRFPPPALADADRVGACSAVWETVCRARPGPASVRGHPAARKRWVDRAPRPGEGPGAESPQPLSLSHRHLAMSLPLEAIRLLLIPWRSRSLQSFHSPHRQTWVRSVPPTATLTPQVTVTSRGGWSHMPRTADLRDSYFRCCRLPAQSVEVFMFWHLN